MSQEFSDPEIFADFIVEAKEHLETIEPTLIELEKAPGNLGLLNDIFRPMHSLKGASGFLGLTRINGLAHKSESVLEELRKGKMTANAEIMDVILASTDALRTMIENLERDGGEGEVETASIIAHLDAILAGESLAPAAAKPAAAPVAPAAAPAEPASAPHTPPPPAAPPPPAPAAEAGAGRSLLGPALPAYKLTIIGDGHLLDFLEEARDLVGDLNASLLKLESDSSAGGQAVNDVFRYFHNLKGNSGIIGYNELNAVTHEAETLLGRMRKGELTATPPLLDLLLSAVDAIEQLIGAIDADSGQVAPPDPAGIIAQLAEASAAESQSVADVGAAVPAPEPEPEPPAAAAATADPEDLAIFGGTVRQQLDNITYALEGLAKAPEDRELVDGLYRSLTTIQNSAAYMAFDEIKVYAERTAGLVDQARRSGLSFELMGDLLSQECAILKDMISKKIASSGNVPPSDSTPALSPKAETTPEPKPAAPAQPAPAPMPEAKPEIEAPVAPPPPPPPPAPEPKASPQPTSTAAKAEQPAAAAAAGADKGGDQKAKGATTIRVDHEKLDHLMNLIGELIINRNRFAMLARSLEEGHTEVQQIAQSLVETTYSMARISDDLQDTIMNVRMMPVGTVFSRFPRLVRDLSRKNGKQVELIMDGEETELDKSVVEVIGDPLVHMIRNSMDHGLEDEAGRLAAGKNPVGKVWLRAYHKGNSVAIEVEDDGKGIDPAKMRQVAVKKGLMSQEQAQALDDREAIEIIFAPGFSSAETVTDISGRGVGMDVVRSNIKNLKGQVNVHSEVGKGTKITMTLPLTLAIIDALIVQIGRERFAIPLDAVSETTKIETNRLSDVNKRKALELRGEVLGIVPLAELLDLPSNGDEREVLPIVVIHDNDRRLGLVVDRLLERQEIVIKPLGTYLADYDLRGVSGATIMGDGTVVLILDPHEVYIMATGGRR